MTERLDSSAPVAVPLAVPLALALLAGILVAWTPRYWREAVPIGAISIIGLVWALTARRVELPRQTILVVLIGIWGFIQLSLHTTSVPWPTTQRSIEWAMSAVCFILGSQILRGRRNSKPFLNLLLWTMTALAVEAMLQRYLTPGLVFGFIPAGNNVVGTIYYKNQFAAMMELAAPLALWKVYDGQVFSGGLCFAAMFAATITSESRMGVVLIVAELLVFLVVMVLGRRMPANSLLGAIAALALLVAGASLVAGTDSIWERLREPDAYALRLNLLNSTLKMIPTHPWQGSGIGTWADEYPRFATYDSALYVNEAHNDWAQWASEGGILFFLLMAALTLWLIKPSLQSVWGLGVLAVMIHSYVDYPLRDPALSFLWFTLAGSLTWVEGRSSRRDVPS